MHRSAVFLELKFQSIYCNIYKDFYLKRIVNISLSLRFLITLKRGFNFYFNILILWFGEDSDFVV